MTEQSIYRHVRELREAFDRPERPAWPEISHGQLLMMMSPKKQHQLVAHRLRLQLESQLGADLVLMAQTDMEDAALGVLRVPDLVVIDEEEAVAEGDAIDPRRGASGHRDRLAVQPGQRLRRQAAGLSGHGRPALPDH
jgi:hypothetical protein